jgi:hypothetical protein
VAFPTNTGAPGTGREHRIGQRRRLAGGAGVRLELGGAGGAELDRPAAALHGERDRHLLDGDHFADELREICDGPALLARVHGEQRGLLRGRDPLVEIDGGLPVALQDVARHVRDHRDRPVGHVHAVDRALVEMPRDDGVAGAEIGILADPAGAQHAAIADFEQPPFEVITHGCLL